MSFVRNFVASYHSQAVVVGEHREPKLILSLLFLFLKQLKFFSGANNIRHIQSAHNYETALPKLLRWRLAGLTQEQIYIKLYQSRLILFSLFRSIYLWILYQRTVQKGHSLVPLICGLVFYRSSVHKNIWMFFMMWSFLITMFITIR